MKGPLLTLAVLEQMRAAVAAGQDRVACSLDLQRSTTIATVTAADWSVDGHRYPYPDSCRERTVYFWSGARFEPVQRFGSGLIKLVPTTWGPPTFEIDGIKMLPTAKLSPWADAQTKVALIQPRGRIVLDTCGGLGYFAAWCQQGQAQQILSFEKNPDVIWLRSLNPWSPETGGQLSLTQADICKHIETLPDRSVDAILHDPPRFGIAGELYSLSFYQQLARVARHNCKLFHYTGTPNKLTSNRDVPREIAARLKRCGFSIKHTGDGILCVRSTQL